MMTDWRTIVGSSDTLSAADLGGKVVTVRIAAVTGGTFEGEPEAGKAAKTARAALVEFEGHEKKLAAKFINCTLIEAMFGAQIEGWVGHYLTLMQDEVEVKGQYYKDPCIRVKGSPEMTQQSLVVTIALPRRRPITRTLVKTPARNEPNGDLLGMRQE
jgi:hypothetical protein